MKDELAGVLRVFDRAWQAANSYDPPPTLAEFDAARATIAALIEQQPIYQSMCNDEDDLPGNSAKDLWMDTPKESLDKFKDRPDIRWRVVYLAPKAPAVIERTEQPVALSDELVERMRALYFATADKGWESCWHCGGTCRERDNYTVCHQCEGTGRLWNKDAIDPMRVVLSEFARAHPSGLIAALRGLHTTLRTFQRYHQETAHVDPYAMVAEKAYRAAADELDRIIAAHEGQQHTQEGPK